MYEKLSIERDLLRRRKKYEAENDPSSPGYAWGMVAEGIDDASKETVTARTDAELTAQNQTRDQWEENGERWQLSERRDPKKNPEYVLYLALKAERDKENVLNALEAKKKEREDEEREEQESRTRKPKQKGRRRKAKGKVQDAEGNNDEEEAATEEGKTKPKKKKKKPLTAAEKIAVERKEKENIEKATRDFEVAREAATRAFSKQNASKTAPEWAPVNGDDCGTTWARYFCYDVVAKLESYYQRLLFLAAQRNLEYRELRGRARGLKEAESILSAIHSKSPGYFKRANTLTTSKANIRLCKQ